MSHRIFPNSLQTFLPSGLLGEFLQDIDRKLTQYFSVSHSVSLDACLSVWLSPHPLLLSLSLFLSVCLWVCVALSPNLFYIMFACCWLKCYSHTTSHGLHNLYGLYIYTVFCKRVLFSIPPSLYTYFNFSFSLIFSTHFFRFLCRVLRVKDFAGESEGIHSSKLSH